MMANLFSTFDPVSSLLNIQLNWISLFLFIIFIFPAYWTTKAKLTKMLILTLISVMKELKMIFKNFKNLLLIISLFMFLLLNNFMGLMPYIFTSTAHISITLSLALVIWVSISMYSWLNFTNHSFAHLVPLGTPVTLMPFMVLIELTSNFIRPITLSVRLAANMTAGHILLSLLGNNMAYASLLIMLILIFLQVMLLILESAVAIIQAYVFATLSTLYASEI